MAVHQRSQSASYQTNNNNNYYSYHNYNNSANNLHINYSPMPSPSPGPPHSRSPTPVTYSSTSPNNNSNYSYGSSNNTHSSRHQQNQNQKNQNMRQQYVQNHHNRSHSACSVNTANYNNFNYENYQMSLQQSSQKQIYPKKVCAQIHSDQRELFQQQARNNMNKNQFASTGQLIGRKNKQNKQNDDLEIKMTQETTEREIKMRQENLKHKLSESINPKKKVEMQIFVRKINYKQKNVIIYESWLNKKGKINKAMQIRYCKVYKDRKLKYFRRADDKKSAGFIDLQTVFAINMLLPKFGISKEKDQHISKLTQIKQDLAINIKTISLKNNEFGFQLVTSKRIWTFSCKNGNIFKNWMNVMKDLCFGKTIYNGYLMKTGAKYKTWKRRFFVIYDLNEMRYFENETLNVQKGKIDLNKVSKIVGINGKKYPYSNCIELHTSERIWILASNSDENREKWMNAIRNVMYENEIAFEFIVPQNSNELSYYKME